MKVKTKAKVKKPNRLKFIQSAGAAEVVERLYDAYNANVEYLNSMLVGRETEIELLYYSIFLGRHIMLEGPPGVAKSALVREVFNTIQDSSTEDGNPRTFYTMMMPTTQPEQLFGPMDMREFREKSRLKYNTERMLPDASLGFIDEVYRGPDSILSCLLNIMHERIFANGPDVVKCPLHTLVGTTNFHSESRIIEAFQDRWMFTYHVEALTEVDEKLLLLQRADSNFTSDVEKPERMDMQDILRFRALVKDQRTPTSVLSLYERLVREFMDRCKRSNDPTVRAVNTVSDRRLVAGLDALKTAQMFVPHQEAAGESDANCFLILRYVLGSTEKQYDVFNEAYAATVAAEHESARDIQVLTQFKQVVTKLRGKYDADMTQPEAEAVLADVNKLQSSLSSYRFSDPKHTSEFEAQVASLKELEIDLKDYIRATN